MLCRTRRKEDFSLYKWGNAINIDWRTTTEQPRVLNAGWGWMRLHSDGAIIVLLSSQYSQLSQCNQHRRLRSTAQAQDQRLGAGQLSGNSGFSLIHFIEKWSSREACDSLNLLSGSHLKNIALQATDKAALGAKQAILAEKARVLGEQYRENARRRQAQLEEKTRIELTRKEGAPKVCRLFDFHFHK